MKTYKVRAYVRTRGSIGKFYPREFTLQATTDVEAKANWFSFYSDRWELQGYMTVREGLET